MDAIAPARSLGRPVQWTLTAGFVLLSWLPLLALTLGFDPRVEMVEKRVLAEVPSLGADPASMASFPSEFEAFWNDHFGFRNVLIRWHHLMRLRLLGLSSNENVVAGTDGWLYYAGQGNLDLFRAATPMTDADLSLWQTHLEESRDWLADRGIPFLFVVAPSKATIYPEHLPSSVRRVGSENRFQQLLRHLRARSTVPVLDLTPTMLLGKEEELVYHPTDTHWNDVGAFRAYRAIEAAVAELLPGVAPAGEDEFRRVAVRRIGGDIAQMLGLADAYEADVVELQPLEPEPFEWHTTGLHPVLLPEGSEEGERAFGIERRVPLAAVRAREDLPTLVMFRDSFGTALLPYMARDYRRAVFYWQYRIDPAVVSLERPDVVVQEVAERYFVRRPVANLPAVRADFERRRRFRESNDVRFSVADDEDRARVVWGAGAAEEEGGPSLRIGSEGGVVAFTLPPLSADAGRDLCLRLEILCEAAVELAFVAADEPEGERRVLSAHELGPGLQIAYLELRSDSAPARVGVELSGPAAAHRLRALEARSVVVPRTTGE